MFCPKCGTQLPDGAMFCSSCGNQLNIQPAAPMMPAEPVAPVMEMPVMTAPVMEMPVMEVPVMETPVMTAPVMETPVMETPMMDAPVMETPVMETPMMETPMMDAPVMDAPMMDAPMMETPVMAVPVMETPVMTAPVMETPVMETPVMETPMMETPVMPVSEPTFNNTAYNPAGQYGYNNVPNATPNNAPINNKQKKSKAPIFIGLGIGALVIAIIAIVLILVLTGDDKKKDKGNKTTVDTTIAETESTTIEETTTEPETVIVEEMDFEDAETLFIKFINAIENTNYSKASKYIYPPILEYFDTEGYSANDVVASFVDAFSDPDGNLLEYRVSSVYLDDSDYYDYVFEDVVSAGFDVEDCDSYIKPSDYAAANIEFTYGDQTSTVQVYFVYGEDGEFYILDYDDSNFYIEYETEFDFEKSLSENYYSFSHPVEGNVTAFNGFTLIVPADWTLKSDGFYYDPANINYVGGASTPLVGLSKLDYLKTVCETYISQGQENLEFGNLILDDKTGYYIESDYLGEHLFCMFFFNDAEDTAYVAIASSFDSTTDNYDLARAIAASLQIQ